MMKQQTYRNHRLRLRNLLLTSALALPMLAMAGNIPQYKVTKGGTPYTEIKDGTPLASMLFNNGNGVLFADGKMFYGEERTAPGFPIGFSFRFGGQIFDSFAISNHGELYLGNGDVAYGPSVFRLGMSTITCGLYKADVSYRTEGEEGNRVLTIQYKNAILNETTKNKGKYNLQLRLHEADGRIEMAFNETETCYGLGGFVTGLRGWDEGDVLFITAPGLDKPFSLSPWSQGWILESDSYINWDDKDYDKNYSPVFLFTPESDTGAPKDAPTDLIIEQKEDKAFISCKRGEDAQATVVLISESPFTDADLPVDGETFRAGQDAATGEWFTRIGNSTALYYGNGETISVEYSGVESGKDYYVCAIPANGYPAYNRENRAEQVLISSQSAPESLRVAQNGPGAFTLTCKADYPVIIATTTEGRKEYGSGYAGVFGTPTAGVSAGDELPDGGRVIYVGEDADGLTVEALPNTLTFFRAWTVDGDRVSATYTDATGIPAVSFPYEPAVEEYPLDFPLWGWQHSDIGQFVAVKRAYGSDRALCATSIEDNEYRLTTPYFTSDRDMTLSFEYAMETEKEAAVGEEGQVMMQGYEPGQFGETGYFRVSSGTGLLKEIREYGGTMKGSISGGNEDGSSSFEPVEVAVPATGKSQSVSFAFSTPKKSRLYLRNIRMEQTGEPIQTGVTEISAQEPLDAWYNADLSQAEVYNVAGVRIKATSLSDLPAGLYIINGNKVMKK
ncbi:MAG: hypothetical protein K2H96_10980 [Muribaculaceae bacterium]|nr:hypothetical protein [Muribaculaceae bacterium]